MPTDPKPPLFPSATVRDIRVAAQACRQAANGELGIDTDKGSHAYFLVFDLDSDPGSWPSAMQGGWADTAAYLEAEADRLDPPPPSTIILTVAPEVYDGFGTRTLDPSMGRDDRGRTIRKVSVVDEHFAWQTTRYDSGMHAWTRPDEAKRFTAIWKLKGV